MSARHEQATGHEPLFTVTLYKMFSCHHLSLLLHLLSWNCFFGLIGLSKCAWNQCRNIPLARIKPRASLKICVSTWSRLKIITNSTERCWYLVCGYIHIADDGDSWKVSLCIVVIYPSVTSSYGWVLGHAPLRMSSPGEDDQLISCSPTDSEAMKAAAESWDWTGTPRWRDLPFVPREEEGAGGSGWSQLLLRLRCCSYKGFNFKQVWDNGVTTVIYLKQLKSINWSK